MYDPEYRWEHLPYGQGHYFLAKTIKEAIKVASEHATEDIVVLQQWRPKYCRKWVFTPPTMANWDVEQILNHYAEEGYDRKLMGKVLENVEPKDIIPGTS